tara:strand:+ start:532 stop:936 length:405 start_codon:yes stop_codon:yes gene_type:complete
MQLTQGLIDKTAITLAIICAIHCLLFPTFLIFFSNFTLIEYNDKLIHLWMLLIVLPISILGLTSGLINHKKPQFFFIGMFGIIILALAILINGEYSEKLLTLLGSTFVAIAHFKNYQLCRNLDCHCHNIFRIKK